MILPGIGATHSTPEAQRLSDECDRIIEGHGFYGEPFDNTRLNILPIEQEGHLTSQRFKE